MNRIIFLVDGFNVYHSLREAERDSGEKSTKWLDLRSLLSSYLSVLGNSSTMEKIYFFSARPYHIEERKKGVLARYNLYLECLETTGVVPCLGRFKRKTVRCKCCKKISDHHEEKETDVAISMKLIEVFHKNEADTVVLVTGDTDLAPAVRTASQLFPQKRVSFAFPYKRKNKELAKLVTKSFNIRINNYLAHQFPNTVALSKGRIGKKPSGW